MLVRKGQGETLAEDSLPMPSSWPTTPRKQSCGSVCLGTEESMLHELERLRSENANLRSENNALEHRVASKATPQHQAYIASFLEAQVEPTLSLDNEFDDPFEPPMHSKWVSLPVASTC